MALNFKSAFLAMQIEVNTYAVVGHQNLTADRAEA